MTIRDDILEAVGGMFNDVDSLRVDVDYVQPGAVTYTPGTGPSTTGDVTHSTAADGTQLRGLFYRFQDLDGRAAGGFNRAGQVSDLQPTDRALELDANDVTWFPRAAKDYVTSIDPADPTTTIREDVVDVLSGPTSVSVVLQVRRAG